YREPAPRQLAAVNQHLDHPAAVAVAAAAKKRPARITVLPTADGNLKGCRALLAAKGGEPFGPLPRVGPGKDLANAVVTGIRRQRPAEVDEIAVDVDTLAVTAPVPG